MFWLLHVKKVYRLKECKMLWNNKRNMIYVKHIKTQYITGRGCLSYHLTSWLTMSEALIWENLLDCPLFLLTVHIQRQIYMATQLGNLLNILRLCIVLPIFYFPPLPFSVFHLNVLSKSESKPEILQVLNPNPDSTGQHTTHKCIPPKKIQWPHNCL